MNTDHQIDTPPAKIGRALAAWLRRDGLVIAFYLLATVVMTYPLIFRLDNRWLAYRDIDTYAKLWDHWWLARTLSTGQPLNFTRDLFHPTGLDLTFHSISWTTTVLIGLLAPLLGNIAAYNFSILFAVFTSAYAAYLLIRTLVQHRGAAWLGGLVFSFVPYHMAHTGGHPDLTQLAAIPLAILFFTRALTRSSVRSALIAAVMLGLVCFTGLYLFEFTIFTLLPAFIYTAVPQKRWRTPRFWGILIVFGLASALLCSPLVVPLIKSPAALSSVIEEKYSADTLQTDLLAYTTPSHFNPIFAPFVSKIAARFEMNSKWPAYLGLVPLILIILAATWKKSRLVTWSWLLLGLFFMIMSLGPVLRFNGQVYENIRLPYGWLVWLPFIRIVARPDYFVLALLLPWAIVAAIGCDRCLGALKQHRRAQMALLMAVSAVLLFEYWNGPYPGFELSIHPIYQQLAQEPGNFAIIDLPMGRNESKDYEFYQTIHQHPIAEGLSGRTPPHAYQYIDGNPLLARWRNRQPLDCNELSATAIDDALQQLLNDGFRYVIVHHDGAPPPKAFAAYFTAAPRFADETLSLYALSDLQTAALCR
jgi:MFS family permease